MHHKSGRRQCLGLLLAGETFDVPAKSGFNIEVKSGLCEYICSYLG